MTVALLALVIGGSAFLVALRLGPPLARAAPRWSLVDHPGGRKLHPAAIPATGGIAIFWGVLVGVCVLLLADAAAPGATPLGDARPGDRGLLLTLLVGAAALHGIGLIDDRRGLGPAAKIAGQAAAVLPLIVLHGMALLPRWLGPIPGSAATLLWFLVVINAFNFLDGLDGLLGGVATLCALEFATVAALESEWTTVLVLAALIGALVGFLPYNLPPARAFAGDNGSLLVGFLIAFASVRITYHVPGSAIETPPHAVLAPLVILGLPFYDFATVIGLRLREGRSPVEGDNSHLAHRLLRRGLRPAQALVLICCCTVATGFGGILLMHVGTIQAVMLAVQALLILAVLALLEWTSRPAR